MMLDIGVGEYRIRGGAAENERVYRKIERRKEHKSLTVLVMLYTNFARFYEDGGTTGSAERDLDSARKIFEKATKVNFKAVEDLAEIWCEWAEMELRHEYVSAFPYMYDSP